MATPLVTLPNLKSYLGVPAADTSADGAMTLILLGVSAAVETWCGRKFIQATYTEYHCGNGTPWLALNNRPLVSVTTVYLDDNGAWGSRAGSFDSTTLLVAGVDYAIRADNAGASFASDSALLYNLAGVWPAVFNYTPGRVAAMVEPGLGNVRVTYVAGYNQATVPDDIQLACYLQAAAVRNSKNIGQLLGSESFSDGAGTMNYQPQLKSKVGVLTPEVTSLLARWRNVAVW